MNSRHIILYDQLPGFCHAILKALKGGDVVALNGEIGAGKTTMTFFLAQAMGLKMDQAFSSPTFTILNQYQLDPWLINHVDLYRLNSFTDLENLDIINLLKDKNSITLIEWGDKFSELQDLYTKKIFLKHIKDKPSHREIICAGFTLDL